MKRYLFHVIISIGLLSGVLFCMFRKNANQIYITKADVESIFIYQNGQVSQIVQQKSDYPEMVKEVVSLINHKNRNAAVIDEQLPLQRGENRKEAKESADLIEVNLKSPKTVPIEDADIKRIWTLVFLPKQDSIFIFDRKTQSRLASAGAKYPKGTLKKLSCFAT